MFTLAIIGRPNVGKSTLFNRIAGKQLAIVNDQPGVTRDWREADGDLYDLPLRIIDTAGLEESFDESIQGRMRKQTEAAIAQADLILFMIDGRSGITPLDEHFASWLRRQNRPVILGVNKCENEKATRTVMGEAYSLGLGDPVALSSAHGHGFDELYDRIQPHVPEPEREALSEDLQVETGLSDEKLDELEGREDFDFIDSDFIPEDEAAAEKALKMTIAGRPNVGKSTLLNAILGEERVMTGPEAGITRDAIAAEWHHKDRKFRLVDTAGMRRKARINDKIEKMAVSDSQRAIRLAQVVVLVIDAENMLEKQDLHIASHIIEEGRAVVIAVNKWDLIEDKKKALEILQYRLDTSLAQIRNIPVVTISALNGRNIDKLMDKVLATYDVWNSRVPTGRMNRWLAGMESQHPAPLAGGRANRLKYITQIKSRPPTFALWVSRPKDLPDSYRRYIINGIRETFNIPGVPIRLLVRASKNPYN